MCVILLRKSKCDGIRTHACMPGLTAFAGGANVYMTAIRHTEIISKV